MTLKELRISLNLTIKDAADAASVPLRTYNRYESDPSYGNNLKREMIKNILKEKYEITETKGILTINQITVVCSTIFLKYKDKINFCYLFGSYAKGYAKDDSDVDLFIATSLSGIDFVGLIEELRESLHKKIDLIRFNDLENKELLNEILKDGRKIYG